MSQKPSKFIYQEIVSKNCERPISCQEKWRKDINLSPKEIINWKVAYQTSFQCTKSSKPITFNFKLLHRRLPTNCFLKKVGLEHDDKCSFCNKETGTNDLKSKEPQQVAGSVVDLARQIENGIRCHSNYIWARVKKRRIQWSRENS